MSANIKTVLHTYRFDVSKPEQATAYAELRAGTLDRIGFPCWITDRRYNVMTKAVADAQKFDDAIKRAAGPIELETKHLFDNQWNSAPVPGVSESGFRLFNWSECKFANRHILQGYWLEQTPEMRAVLREMLKCGYCGKQEPASSGLKFCPHCLDSAYLKESQLHLTRLAPVCDTNKPRAPLSAEELAERVPLYRDAQIHGSTERGRARMAKMRDDLTKERDAAIRKAEVKFAGFTWLLDHGINPENVIYYSHTDTFCVGWRNPIDASAIDGMRAAFAGFPFKVQFDLA